MSLTPKKDNMLKTAKTVPFIKNPKYIIFIYIPLAMLSGFFLNNVLPLTISHRLPRVVAQTAIDWSILMALGYLFYRLLSQEFSKREKSREHYQVLTEKSLAGIYLIQNNRFCYANAMLAKILNYTTAELVDGIEFVDLVHPEEREVQINRFQRLMTGEISEDHFTFRGLKKDGTVVHLEIFGRTVDHNGKPAVAGTILDITERKRAEEELQFQAKLLDNAFDSIMANDLEGNIIYANRAGYVDRGYGKEELLAKKIVEIVAPEGEEQTKGRLEQMPFISLGETILFESTHLHKDGHRIPIEVRASIIEVEGQKIFLGVARDITERKQAQEKLQESEAKFRSLFETLTEGVALHEIICDEHGVAVDYRISSTNRAFKNHTGLEPDLVQGQLASIVYGTPVPFLEEYARVTRTGQPHSFETFCPTMQRHFRISVTSPQQGQFVTVFEDITESKASERVLKNAHDELERRVKKRTAELQSIKDRMTHIMDTVPVVIFSMHPFPPYQATFVSDHIRDFGFTPDEFLGDPGFWLAHVHPEDLEFLDHFVESLLKHGYLSHLYRFRTASGEYIWIRGKAKLIRDRDGNPVEVIGYWADVTRLMQLEQKLEILSVPGRKIGVWGKSSGVLSVLTPTLQPGAWDRLKECLQAALKGEIISGVSVRLELPDGSFLHGLLSAGPIREKEKDYIATVGIIIRLSQDNGKLH